MVRYWLVLPFIIYLILDTSIIYGQRNTINSLPLISSYTSEEYEAGMQNWTFGQSKEGIIYIGNNSGLLEFDGDTWHTYPVDNGTKVRSMVIDPNNKIYVGAQGEFGYFERRADGLLDYNSLTHFLPEQFPIDETWSVYLKDSAVYYCTFRHILKYKDEKIEIIDPEMPIGFSFKINEELYVHIPEKGLCRLQNDKTFELVPGGDLFANYSVRNMIPTGIDRYLIITHGNGIFLYNNGQVESWADEIHELISNGLINCAIQLRNGKIAVGTQNEGVIIINAEGGLSNKINEKSGLADRTVNHLFEDDHGNLWASLHDGLSYIEIGSPFGLISENVGVFGSGYAAAIYQNEIFIGTNNNVFRWNKNNYWQDFEKIKGSEGQAYSLQVFKNQVILSHHNGAFTINNDQIKKIADVEGTWMFLDPKNHNDKLLAGHYTGLYLLQWKQGSWQFQNRYEGFNESCRVLAEDDNHNIWMTHGYKGVYKIQFSEDFQEILKVDYYNQNHGFPSNFLINVFELKGELVFAAESGIYFYSESADNFKLHPYLNQFFNPESHIREMEADPFGNIYFIADDEAGVLTKNSQGGYEKKNAVFNKIVPYLNDALEKIEVIDHQTILFSAKHGFVMFNPTFQYQIPNPGRALIRRLEVISDSTTLVNASVNHLTPDTTFIFNYPNNSLRITYASPLFGVGNKAQFRYRLNNFDKEWSAWTHTSSKEYTNLREGDYQFQLQVKNVFGEVSETSNLVFRILPPWYRSNMAYFSYLLSGMSGLFLLVAFLERKHRKEKTKLKNQQQEALEMKDIKLNLLSKQSQEEITRLRNEKLKAEIEHKNKELGNAAMHLISKNEFINHLKKSLNALSKKSQNKSMKGDFHKIMVEIEKNIAADNDWEQFEIHFDKVHGNFSERLKSQYPDLTPQEMKIAAYLRMNLSTKDITQLLNISVRGVEIARYRLRKKLELERKENLSEFILKF